MGGAITLIPGTAKSQFLFKSKLCLSVLGQGRYNWLTSCSLFLLGMQTPCPSGETDSLSVEIADPVSVSRNLININQ